MDARDEWKAQEPPPGFADAVMDRIGRTEGTPKAPRRTGPRLRLAAGLALAAAVALGVGWSATRAPSQGDVIARERSQVELGARGIAVLEPGAHVSWSGDLVSQPAGDVFYRVEPGKVFRVRTPSGDVTVMGTCFRVQVTAAGEASEANENRSEVVVNGRDVKVAAISAAVSAAALVTVYEGKVSLARAKDSVALAAGEKARANRSGVHRVPGDGAKGADEAAGPSAEAEPLLAANANLADSVRDYKRRLEAIEAQKKGVEKKLAEAQEMLATATRDGQALPARSKYDLSPDDWKQLAQDGTVRARFPCLTPSKQDQVTPAGLQKAGLAPDDGPVIEQAIDASRARVWATIRPLCASALQGDATMADKLGPATCMELVRDVAATNGTDVSEEMRQVAEIRAGIRPMPADGGGPVMRMMLALTNESGAVEQDLTQQLGPSTAHSIAYGTDMPGCWNNSSWGVGPRPAPSAAPAP